MGERGLLFAMEYLSVASFLFYIELMRFFYKMFEKEEYRKIGW